MHTSRSLTLIRTLIAIVALAALGAQGHTPDVQAAVHLGRGMVGMTRELTIVAVGYPLTSEAATLDSSTWRHWVSSVEEYQLLWGSDGLIREICAVDTVRKVIVYQTTR